MAATMKRPWLIVVPVLLLAGCSLTSEIKNRSTEAVFPNAGIPFSSAQHVRDALYQQYGEWRAVRYRRGGLSKEGIDCSGFVYLTYQGVFGVMLPRSTSAQARVGKRIPRRHLKPGDLVFFKTGIFSRHVGIYLVRDTFLHVSLRKGVTLSNLDGRYWSRRYWQSRRITTG